MTFRKYFKSEEKNPSVISALYNTETFTSRWRQELFAYIVKHKHKKKEMATVINLIYL